MNIRFDLPTVVVAVAANVAISKVSIPQGWLLNPDSFSVPFLLGTAALIILGLWLAFFHGLETYIPLYTNWLQFDRPHDVMSFIPKPYFVTNFYSPLSRPALNPFEWIDTQAYGKSHQSKETVARNAFKNILTDGRRSDALVRALTMAVHESFSAQCPNNYEINRLSELGWSGIYNHIPPDFEAAAADILERNPSLQLFDEHNAQLPFPVTALLEEIEAARRNGWTLPSATFRWVKEYDRSLYYAINNLGRKAMFVEGMGISAHYAAEKRAGTALDVPHVDEAVETLGAYFLKHDLINQDQWKMSPDEIYIRAYTARDHV